MTASPDGANVTPDGGTRRSHVVALLAALLTTLLGSVFFGRFAPAGIVIERLVWPLLAAMLGLFASIACGSAALAMASTVTRRLSPFDAVAAQPWNDRLVIGIPAYGLFLAVIAFAGVALGQVTIVTTILLAGVGIFVTRGRWQEVLPRVSTLRLLLFAPPVAVGLIGAVTPVASPDELIYKLGLAREYLLFGRMVELPLNSHSYIPAATFMSELGPLALSGGIAAKILFFCLFVASLRAIHGLAARLNENNADFVTALIAWTPALMLLAGWCWSEWSLLGLGAISCRSWNDFVDSRAGVQLATAFLALALGLSSSYPFFIFAAAFLVIVLITGLRSKILSRIIPSAALILLFFGTFFLIRNLVWTGSPVAPFLLPGSPAVENFRGAAGTNGFQELLRGYDILHPGIIDDSLGILVPVAVLLSPFVLLRRRRSETELFALGALQLPVLVALAPTSRLIILGVFPLALLGADAMAQGWRSLRPLPRRSLAALWTAALIGQLLLVSYVLVVSYDFFPYLVGHETAEEMLARTRAFAPVYSWAGARTDPGSRFLVLGENRTYDLDRQSWAAGNLDGPRVSEYLSSFGDAASLRGDLLSKGITHVLVHKSWYRVQGAAGPAGMLEREFLLEVPPRTDTLLKDFLRRSTVRRYEDPQYAVFEVH